MVKKAPRVIEHYDGEIDFLHKGQSELFADSSVGVVLDVETTGLSFETDSVIELGLVQFEFDPKTGHVLEVLAKEDFLQDPGKPLSDEIKNLTGLTDEMLKGQSIDVQRVDEIFDQSQIIIAHNAFFDRAFINKLFNSSKKKLWACSKDDIDWRQHGHACRTLQHLCNDLDFYYDGHRAEIDCLALLKLISKTTKNGNTYLKTMVDNANSPTFIINAVKAPFESKDLLKNNNFRWNPDKKFWFKKVTAEELDGIEKLMKSVYKSRGDESEVIEESLHDRFLS